MFRENKKTPEIRFPGFTEDWEQRKFGDIGTVSMCKRIFKNETSDKGEIPFYKIGTFGGEPDAYISRELFEEYKGKFSYPNKGDILLSASGTIGRIVEYDGEEAYFQDSNIVWLSHDESVCNKFLKVLYPVIRWDGIEGSTIQRLYNDNFLKTRFMMPSVEEQEKIGEYFSRLDNLITLHQRKCDALQTLKKTMLQKMFPQKGASVPEIRFPSFTEDWEQRKLGDVTSVATFKPYLKEIDEDGEYEVIQQGDKPLAGYANGNPFEDYEKVTLFGDHTLSLYKAKAPFFVASDGVKILFSKDMNGYFYYYLLENYKPQSEGYKRHFSILKVCECSYPTNITEQRKIGEYFSNLDNLITLHQRKCDTLRELKKAMLQKMFV